jgi:hypothetical protein
MYFYKDIILVKIPSHFIQRTTYRHTYKLQRIISLSLSLSLSFEKSQKKKSNISFDIPIMCNLNAPTIPFLLKIIAILATKFQMIEKFMFEDD